MTQTEVKTTKAGKRWLKIRVADSGSKFFDAICAIAVAAGVDLASPVCRVILKGKKTWVEYGDLEIGTFGRQFQRGYKVAGFWLPEAA